MGEIIIKLECRKCGTRLQSVRTSNSRFNKKIPNVLVCPKCPQLYKAKLVKIGGKI